MRPTRRVLLAACLWFAPATAVAGPELLYVSEGNRLRRYDVDTIEAGNPLGEVLIENAGVDPDGGRDVNGPVCAFPDDPTLFVMGEDTGQPHPPAGWGVFTSAGGQVGKLTTSSRAEVPDPYGCAFGAGGRLFTTETGTPFFGRANGQLIAWFPPLVGFPGRPGAYPDTQAFRTNACALATDLGTALGIAIDPQGRVYVAAASGREVVRFDPPFPSGPGPGCGAADGSGPGVRRQRFLGPLWRRGLVTYSGLAWAPGGNLYVASVATGRIAEFDREGRFVRMLLDPGSWLPPYPTGYPLALAVDGRGTLYYTDLDLELRGLAVEPGADGKVWRIRFDAAGAPRPPEIVIRQLAFPDGLGIGAGDLELLEGRAAGRLARAGPLQPAPTRPPGAGGAGGLVLLAVVAVTAGAIALARRGRSDRL